jgi:CRISPR-associated protein Cas1
MAELRQNVLYLTTEGLYVHHELEVLKVKQKDTVLISVPLHHLHGIVIFGASSMSASLMYKCLQRGICITYLTRNGRFLGMVSGSFSGNILMRSQQFKLSQDEKFCLNLAQSFIAGKIQNSRQVLLRSARENDDEKEAALLRNAAVELETAIKRIPAAKSCDELRGIEGDAAKKYFSVLNYCIRKNRSAFEFDKRTRRPPRSRINALLSFAYSLFTNDCISACQASGLDPFCGFFHTLRPGRPALALDLIEELRPFADRFVLTLINRMQIQPEDIEEKIGGTYTIKENARKRFIQSYQERKHEELTHDFLQQKCLVMEIPFLQARILGRVIRGDIKNYVPFLWR